MNSKNKSKTLVKTGDLSSIKDEKALQLIKTGKFELQKYELCQVNWSEHFRSLHPKNIQEVFVMKTPTIATIRKYKDEFRALVLIADMITEASEFFNVGKNMNDTQVQMTAQLIIRDFYFLTVADLRLCFLNAYSNKYGKLFDRLDGAVILEWLNKYTEDRLQEAQKRSQKLSDGSKDVSFAEQNRIELSQIIDKISVKTNLNKTNPVKKKPETLEEFIEKSDSDRFADLSERIVKSYYHERMIYEKAINKEDFLTLDQFMTMKKRMILNRLNKAENIDKVLSEELDIN